MPVITISSVNTSTEEITATAHGLLTGERFRVRNVGGALPAATPALAAATDYFAVRVDADTLKASDTNAHALAGTNIVNLTGAGSGTNTIEYGLPYCLPTAAAGVGMQVKSENDNRAWAALVALYELLVGQAQSVWSGVVLAGNATVNGTLTAGVISGPLKYTAITPTALPLTPNTSNDYNPTGLSTAVIVRLTTSGVSAGGPFITGVVGGVDGRILHVYNAGPDSVTFKNQDSGSAAANRLITSTGASLVAPVDSSTSWLYDGTSARWRLLAKTF